MALQIVFVALSIAFYSLCSVVSQVITSIAYFIFAILHRLFSWLVV